MLSQVGYFGLFVDGSFERGMSRPAATFENPCLASAETFEVDTVECWRVQPPTPEELEEAAREHNSVLDKCVLRPLLLLTNGAGRCVPPLNAYKGTRV